MIRIDLHTHSLFSCCGLHTILELLDHAKSRGMEAIAITDHGITLGKRAPSTFFERFVNPYQEIVLLKGIECNILSKRGEIDFPEQFTKYIDITLAGIHPNIATGKGKAYYTGMVVKTILANPQVKIITHPANKNYPLDYDVVAQCALENQVALELNNSKIKYGIAAESEMLKLLEACKKHGTAVAINSDAHAVGELGDDSQIIPLLNDFDFPVDQIVNRNLGKVFHFINRNTNNV